VTWLTRSSRSRLHIANLSAALDALDLVVAELARYRELPGPTTTLQEIDMADLYSTRFLLERSGAGAGPKYVVPNGYIAIVRDISATSATGTTDTVALGVYAGAAGLEAQFATGEVFSNTQAFHWEGRVVVYAGEDIQVSSTDLVSYTVSGYLLYAP
jgi:hypothetical protein